MSINHVSINLSVYMSLASFTLYLSSRIVSLTYTTTILLYHLAATATAAWLPDDDDDGESVCVTNDR